MSTFSCHTNTDAIKKNLTTVLKDIDKAPVLFLRPKNKKIVMIDFDQYEELLKNQKVKGK